MQTQAATDTPEVTTPVLPVWYETADGENPLGPDAMWKEEESNSLPVPALPLTSILGEFVIPEAQHGNCVCWDGFAAASASGGALGTSKG